MSWQASALGVLLTAVGLGTAAGLIADAWTHRRNKRKR